MKHRQSDHLRSFGANQVEPWAIKVTPVHVRIQQDLGSPNAGESAVLVDHVQF